MSYINKPRALLNIIRRNIVRNAKEIKRLGENEALRSEAIEFNRFTRRVLNSNHKMTRTAHRR